MSLQRPRGDAARLPSAAPGAIPPAKQLLASSTPHITASSSSSTSSAGRSSTSSGEGAGSPASALRAAAASKAEDGEGGSRSEEVCSPSASPVAAPAAKKVSFPANLLRRSFSEEREHVVNSEVRTDTQVVERRLTGFLHNERH